MGKNELQQHFYINTVTEITRWKFNKTEKQTRNHNGQQVHDDILYSNAGLKLKHFHTQNSSKCT